VTDIGNDLLYGASVEQIATWVDVCLARLSAAVSMLIVTELPLASTQIISERRFRLLRNVFFPRSRLTLQESLTRGLELNDCVKQLAAKHRAVLVKPSLAWYGFDPIHIRRTRSASVWREILHGLSPSSDAGLANPSLAQWMALRRLRPLERTLWGREQRQPQPAGRLPDGTTISLY
jgi:hypothetical protein